MAGSGISKKIDRKLARRESSSQPVTLSLNSELYRLLQECCREENERLNLANVKARKIKPSAIINYLIEEYLTSKGYYEK